MSEDWERTLIKLRYRVRNEDPTALEDAVRLAEQHAEDPRIWFTLSHAHEAREDHAASMTAINRAIELDPRQPVLLLERGRYALRTGDNERALADFSQGLVLSDELNWDYYRETFHHMRAEALVRLGRTEEALADLPHVHLRNDIFASVMQVRTKAELLVACGASVPPPEEDEEEPASSEPLTYSGNPLVTSQSVLSESPDEEEAALAKELGPAGLAAIDAALVKHVIYRYQKAARVINEALSCDGHSSDDEPRVRLYARRLIALAEAGTIEARGNLYRPTRSEVALPDRP